ncbi:hypothetical protein FB451DRAFT_1253037 [Mycena latifolia]|nr:hypothetical protein FB451DRAFT_1253037 [Mycena latifolia]
MRVTIPDDARSNFLAELRRWTQKSRHGVRRSLREWQALAGYANWVFNVFPSSSHRSATSTPRWRARSRVTH